MPSPDGYRLYLNDRRTILLRIWDDGKVELTTRPDAGDIWAPPVELEQEIS